MLVAEVDKDVAGEAHGFCEDKAGLVVPTSLVNLNEFADGQLCVRDADHVVIREHFWAIVHLVHVDVAVEFAELFQAGDISAFFADVLLAQVEVCS